MKNHHPLRRGLSLVEAAAYVGVHPDKFADLVARGVMPKPKLIDAKRVWDVEVIDLYFTALPYDERTESERRPRVPLRPGQIMPPR